MRYWTVDAASDGTTVTKLIPSEQDGEFYYSFGLRKYKTKSSELIDFKTFRVIFEGGRLVEVEENESLTKAEPEMFGISVEDVFPMTFKVE